jgi:hypothetical protein
MHVIKDVILTAAINVLGTANRLVASDVNWAYVTGFQRNAQSQQLG